MEQKAIDYSGLVASICEKRLEELFPAGIPLDVSERFSRELRCMNETGHAKTLYEYYVFADAAEEALIPLMVRGLANDSILTYLLGNNMVNPLEAYYYCPSCGYYERIPDYWYGIDATVKKCPKCGQGIQGQGFSLNWRILWGTRGTRGIHFEYIAPPSFLPYARNCVEALYPDNVVVELADDEFRIVYGTDEDVIKRGFAVLPTGKNEEDYLDKKYIFPDGSSAYILDIEAENEGVIRIIFNWFKPEDLLKIMLPASSTSLSMRDKVQIITRYDSTIDYDFEQRFLFCSREELFRLLLEAGNDEVTACDVMEVVRKGLAVPDRYKPALKQKWPVLKQRAVIPQDILAICEKTHYLSSEGYAIAILACSGNLSE
jgi:hypothetical protein